MQVQTLNIALPKLLVKKVDQLAREEYRNRSELIREALRVYLQEKAEWKELFEFGQKQARKLSIKGDEDIQKIVSKERHGK